MTPVVYIAGRFRGPTAWDIEQNVRRAEEFALTVARAGAMPLIPHANTRYFHGQCDDQFWIDGTAELLVRCDALALVPENWQGSAGTRGELQIAAAQGMLIFAPTREDFERVVGLGIRHDLVYAGFHALENWIQTKKGVRFA